MKTILVWIILVFPGILCAQSWEGALSYHYLYSKQWDRSIQTYNFSRPHLEKPQPLFQHGFSIKALRTFHSNGKYNQGLSLSYSGYKSMANNPGFQNNLYLQVLQLGYFFRLHNLTSAGKLFVDPSISLDLSSISRRLNGEPYEYEGISRRAFGIGGSVSLRLGYPVATHKQLTFLSFVQFGWSPYHYSPNAESILNQTTGLITETNNRIAVVEIGVVLKTMY
jgi:hypothetical protein